MKEWSKSTIALYHVSTPFSSYAPDILSKYFSSNLRFAYNRFPFLTILTERFKETVRLDLEVTYISGATGTGKTRGVLESNGYSNVYRVTDYLHPFDGYACQSVICFDEFRASLKLKDMLMYCDIYPIELPSRYANKFACYNKVYIVSNWALEKQYPEIQREDKESWQAFLRRIHKVICYDDSGEKTEYQSVEDYFSRNEDFVLYTGTDLPFDK